MDSESSGLDRLLTEKEDLLVDFYADWCEPCKWAEPVLDEVIKKFSGKLSLHKINIDKFPDLALRYHVMSVPTLVLFKKGEELWRMRGFDIAPRLYASLKAYIS
jgi:thioredoxin 1